MKALSLITRRDDLDRQAFRNYYESTHCLLAMKYFPFAQYVRNHLLDAEDLDFDCITEVRLAQVLDVGRIMRSESRNRVLDDEAQFMRQEMIRVGSAHELLLSDWRDIKPAGGCAGERVVVLLPPNASATAQLVRAQTLLQVLAGGEFYDIKASLDQLQKGASILPFAALLWLEAENIEELQSSLTRALKGDERCIRVATCRSDADELKERFVAFLP
ncbi:EthD domain-containing protein [Halopseudomonas phragmitis]|uniref:EthD domain-containing protein n=1 Tax=Halopseudomonas phragmitis TaxID=1931241 RepID=A0A1V0B9R5_9GAMM|nr:EthD domain-containing protein [Halopseudomonas phragmitis]AQZ96524.1 hypothetical protein BVH74_17990 [Halopseudomonas phragmitis]